MRGLMVMEKCYRAVLTRCCGVGERMQLAADEQSNVERATPIAVRRAAPEFASYRRPKTSRQKVDFN